MAGHRLVIETRDDMQVGVEPALIVPAERVAVRSEPLVKLGSYDKQKFPCRCPLLGGQVERRNSVSLRYDGAAARDHIGRITRISSRGVDAEVVLEVQVRLAKPVVIAKDTAFGHRTVLLADEVCTNLSQVRSPSEDVVEPRISQKVAVGVVFVAAMFMSIMDSK